MNTILPLPYRAEVTKPLYRLKAINILLRNCIHYANIVKVFFPFKEGRKKEKEKEGKKIILCIELFPYCLIYLHFQ